MGVVFRARDPAADRLVALKVLAHEAAPAGTRRQRMEREGELTAHLDHPHVVRVHSAGSIEGRRYLAYELLEGSRPLSEAWDLPLERRLELLRQAAAGLAHAHERGILHRDVKADNILVTAAGEAKLADFGVATAVGLERLTRTGALIGTPSHMAPEQVTGDRGTLGPATDVWALGVTLYHQLTGELPFDAETLVGYIQAIKIGRYPLPSRVAPGVSPPLEAVVRGALQVTPAHRFPHAGAFAEALEVALNGRRPTRLTPRRAGAVALGVTMAFAGLAGGARASGGGGPAEPIEPEVAAVESRRAQPPPPAPPPRRRPGPPGPCPPRSGPRRT
jgi:serine/threonine-protein kinase